MGKISKLKKKCAALKLQSYSPYPPSPFRLIRKIRKIRKIRFDYFENLENFEKENFDLGEVAIIEISLMATPRLFLLVLILLWCGTSSVIAAINTTVLTSSGWVQGTADSTHKAIFLIYFYY